uniref:Calmodulin n=1 Tax=Bicosoecida sp. CB-2014 TaxID=1486930 RepID=A0A7S1G9Y4_9STRA|mmetsp:Transcript_25333/g.88437  ORF Transcript_25333/g.88437 Transcript_25333/m.88437 type:complete len:165 (+) Transcript_25333:138-632(+)
MADEVVAKGNFAAKDAEITPEMKEQYKVVFAEFDADGGGSIDTAEVKAVMMRLGQHPTDEEVQAIVDRFDADGSGSIEFEEFCQMMSAQMGRSSGEELMAEAFRFFDQDNEGFIDVAKLRVRLRELGEDPDDATIQSMVDAADHDGGGKMTLDEFRDLVTMINA